MAISRADLYQERVLSEYDLLSLRIDAFLRKSYKPGCICMFPMCLHDRLSQDVVDRVIHEYSEAGWVVDFVDTLVPQHGWVIGFEFS